MKTVEEFISYLRSQGVKLWPDGDHLRYSAPKGTLTETLREKLAKQKAEILHFLNQANISSQTMSTNKIKRIGKISKEEFQKEFYLRNEPVIVEEICKDWPALHKWNSDYLCQYLKDNKVLCSQSSSQKHPDFEAMEINRHVPFEMAFDKYIEHIISASSEEVPKIALNRLIFAQGEKCNYRHHIGLEGLKNDFYPPNLLHMSNLEVGVVWIQGKNTQSWLHNDEYENLYVQVNGRKKIMLMHPEQSFQVYNNRKNKGYCEVDAFEPDYNKFPHFKDAIIYESILNPGEMLYLPEYSTIPPIFLSPEKMNGLLK